MARPSKERIATLLRAKHHETVKTPLYYAPPFLDELRKSLQERLASRGGRPTVAEWDRAEDAVLQEDLAVAGPTRRAVESGRGLCQPQPKWPHGSLRRSTAWV